MQSLGLERTFLDKDINTGGEVRATAAHKLPQRVAQNQNSCSLARNLAPRDSAVEIAAVDTLLTRVETDLGVLRSGTDLQGLLYPYT